MAFNFSKGTQIIGDLSGSDDPNRNTGIDFEDDEINLVTSGSVRMQVNNDGVFIPDLDPSTAGPVALRISGGVEISPGHNAGLTFKKGNNELNFIAFANEGDTISSNARMSYQVAEHLFIYAGRQADFYVQTAQASGNSTYPFRIMDDGTTRFEKGLEDGTVSAADLAPDIAFYVSGTVDGNNNALFEGNVVMSGALNVYGDVNAKLRHINTAKYTESSADPKYVRWDAAGSNGTPGVNNKFVAPAKGSLSSISIRATNAANSTDIRFHKSSNGTENLNTTPTETQTVNMASANTTYQVQFASSTFNAGDILGISLNPTVGFGNVNITCVWLFDWNS